MDQNKYLRNKSNHDREAKRSKLSEEVANDYIDDNLSKEDDNDSDDRSPNKEDVCINEEVKESHDDVTDINCLPDEIIIHIFHYLKQNKLGRIARVCRRWNALTRSPVLWKIVDVYFSNRYHRSQHRSQNDAAMGFIINMLPSCASCIKLNLGSTFGNRRPLPLHFGEFSVNIHKKCSSIEMLSLCLANLSNSLSAVINLCTHFLKNVKVLIFKCCEFKGSSVLESYGGISKIEILHLLNCRHLNKPPFSKMPHLKILRVTQPDLSSDINSWFKDDTSFLNRLEILHLQSIIIAPATFLTIQNQGFHLTELYLCHSLRSGYEDLSFNKSANVFPHLKIVCLNGRDITFNVVFRIIQSCPSLQRVYVYERICWLESERSLLNKFQIEICYVRNCHHTRGNYDYEGDYDLYK